MYIYALDEGEGENLYYIRGTVRVRARMLIGCDTK
jgi:hypothetical protein